MVARLIAAGHGAGVDVSPTVDLVRAGNADVEGAGGRFASASEQAARPRPGVSSDLYHDGPTQSTFQRAF
jgi:hypothetical protein